MIGIDLEGRNALITGGSRGIGAACCRLLAQAGASVGVHYHRNEEAAREVARAAAECGVYACSISADVSDEEEVCALFQAFRSEIGPLDILVTSAGIWRHAPLREMDDEAWSRTLDVNLKGTLLCCREAMEDLTERGGSMTLISSTAGQRGEAEYAHYAASKGGVQALARSLAVELAPRVRVNCVAPGWVDTEMASPALQSTRELPRILKEIPLRRVAEPEDVAGAVLFLASDLARHVTGEILNVNGGSVMC